jgi:hypothetical protein
MTHEIEETKNIEDTEVLSAIPMDMTENDDGLLMTVTATAIVTGVENADIRETMTKVEAVTGIEIARDIVTVNLTTDTVPK